MNHGEGDPTTQTAANRWLQAQVDPLAYDRFHEQRAQAGENIHGEVDFLCSLLPLASCTLLDAGCGTGRVAIEAALRGAHVVGVDLDERMVARARLKAPHLDWRVGDLATLSVDQSFDLVVLAGNVMICLTPDSEATVLAHLIPALAPGGLLVAGFATDREYYRLADYDETLASWGLILQERWATWDRQLWTSDATFAVSVHRGNT